MSAPQYPGQPFPQPAQPPKKKGLSTGCIIAIVVVVVGAVPLIGIISTLAIYGVRRYLVTAKTAEARNTVGAITRAAVASYESNRRVCASAIAVPAIVPKAARYQPSMTDGADFNTGDSNAGWRCLRFSMSQPMYYQYQYHAGSGYLTRAGAEAGPKGFEAAAIGDLNGDGVQSHFARAAHVDPSGQLVVSTELYIDNEFE